MKVLIVDDIPTNLKVLRAALESNNLQVVEAADGWQALETLETEPVNAIISDILMPRMDGYRLCYEVRRSERLRALPFIFYSATYTSPSDEKLCLDLGGNKYLQKPASPKVIVAALDEAVELASRSSPARVALPPESDVMRQYSQRLVSKLEARNAELARAKESLEEANLQLTARSQELERARRELHESNCKLEQRVRQRTKELEAANQELEAFSYSVSHDLRAPLRHIAAYASLILKNSAHQLDEQGRLHLQRVSEAVTRMHHIIEGLLELTRVTRTELQQSPVDLSALAHEVMEELSDGSNRSEAQVDIAPGLDAVGDRRLLRIALVNLLGNALKFTSKRNDPLIQFGKIDCGDAPPYFVRDNGVGFDMAYAGKLFGAFHRMHTQEEFEGSGIGLATVRRIIQRHHGKTWAEGARGLGATFYFTLGESV